VTFQTLPDGQVVDIAKQELQLSVHHRRGPRGHLRFNFPQVVLPAYQVSSYYVCIGRVNHTMKFRHSLMVLRLIGVARKKFVQILEGRDRLHRLH
jgi:hypothetical protein